MRNTHRGKDGKLRFRDSDKLVHKWIARKEAIKAAKRYNQTNNSIMPFVHVLIFFVFTLSLLGAKQYLISKVVSFFVGLIISAYYSLIVNSIAEASGLNVLKKYIFTVEFIGLKYSGSAFALIVLLIEWYLLK